MVRQNAIQVNDFFVWMRAPSRVDETVSMFRRRHDYTRRVLRQARRRWLRANAVGLAVVSAGYLALVIGVAMFIRSDFLRGFVIGASAATYLGSLTVAFLVTSGAVYQLGGAWGEDNTREVLKSARRRGHVWGAVHNVEVSGVDIDHIVIAPVGAIAVDSKWHFSEIDHRTLERDVRNAREAAGHAKSVLRSADVKSPMDVTPFVVIWGPGQREIPDAGIEYDGVQVVAGGDFAKRIRSWRHGRVSEDYARSVLERLSTFADVRRGRRELPEPRPAGSGIRQRAR